MKFHYQQEIEENYKIIRGIKEEKKTYKTQEQSFN